MSRTGSPPGAGSGGRPQGPYGATNIGEVATPPFAVLPDPVRLFAVRAERFRTLAPGHQLAGYLRFLGAVADIQHAIQATLPPAALPQADRLAQARAHAMPPISLGHFAPETTADATLAALLDGLAPREEAATAAATIATVRAASTAARRQMMQAILLDDVPHDAIAAHVLAAAALQVHFARLAVQLDVVSLQKVASGVCPACGGRPVSSAVVAWEGAANTRFCTCSLCATQWNAPRVVCLVCGGDKGITYQTLEGGAEHIKAECCEACSSYVKILYQLNDPALEAVADDVASLGLDMLLREEGLARHSANPFLLGY